MSRNQKLTFQKLHLECSQSSTDSTREGSKDLGSTADSENESSLASPVKVCLFNRNQIQNNTARKIGSQKPNPITPGVCSITSITSLPSTNKVKSLFTMIKLPILEGDCTEHFDVCDLLDNPDTSFAYEPKSLKDLSFLSNSG